MGWPKKSFTFPRPERESSWRYKSLADSGQLRLPQLSKEVNWLPLGEGAIWLMATTPEELKDTVPISYG